MTIAQVINLAILAALLYKLLYKPVGNLISNRQSAIQAELAEAKERQAQAEALLAEYQAKIADAEKEVQAILDRAKQAGEQSYAEILREARKEADRMLERAQLEIEAERERALALIRAQIADEAIQVAKQLASENLTESDQIRIARNFIAKVEEFR